VNGKRCDPAIVGLGENDGLWKKKRLELPAKKREGSLERTELRGIKNEKYRVKLKVGAIGKNHYVIGRMKKRRKAMIGHGARPV